MGGGVGGGRGGGALSMNTRNLNNNTLADH